MKISIISAIICVFLILIPEVSRSQELEIFAVDDFIDPAEWMPVNPSVTGLPDKFFISVLSGGTVYCEKHGIWYRKDDSSEKTLEELYNLNYPHGLTSFFRTSNDFYLGNSQFDWKFTFLGSHENRYVNYNNKFQFGRYLYPEDNEGNTERIQFTWNIDSFQDDISNQFCIGLDTEELTKFGSRNTVFAEAVYAFRPEKRTHYLTSTAHIISYKSFLDSKLDFSGRISAGGIGWKWRMRPYKIQFLWEIPVDYINGSIYALWASHLWLDFKPFALSTNNEFGLYIGTPVFAELF